MRTKTSVTYKNEILAKYNREKGGEMMNYLFKPTRKQIKEACLWLLNRRRGKYDESILNRFFKFKEGENKMLAIENTPGDRFKPIINFLIGETKSTTPANLELISWLIDFKPRPLSIYLNSNFTSSVYETKLLERFSKEETATSNTHQIDRIPIPETKVVEKTDKSITIISQINPSLRITTIVSL